VADALSQVSRDDIPKDARELVDTWLSPANLRAVAPSDVPLTLRDPFTEHDGRTDRVVLIYPTLKVDYNDARNVLKFAARLSSATPPPGTVAGGGFLFMAEIIRLVMIESPRVVGVVALLVALVLIPFFAGRPLRIVAIVASITSVALVAQVTMIALGVRVNMLNFAAVPITIGVGADYLVNLYGAMDAFGVSARRACARMGGAILLCSATTVVGYLSLVMAQSGALRTFGWAAVLGEISAVLTVLVILPVGLRENDVPSEEAAEALAAE
jgi:predicted RND superfamily exporter protein